MEEGYLNFSENAMRVLQKRYLAKNEKGEVIETPGEMFRRVAKNITGADKLYGKDADIKGTEEEFYKVMTNREFLPNSPTLMNAGRELQQLSACFVLSIDDSMESIFETLKNTSLIHKSGGGTGFSFSRLRPKNSQVRSTGGVASGPVSFLKVFDAATQAVKQGGCVAPNTRIATKMGLLRIKELGPINMPADSWHKYNPHPVVVATDSGPQISDEFYNHGVSLVRTIKTKNGYKVTGTLQHRLRVIDEKGEYVWRHIKDIKRGDWVALQKDTYMPDKSFLLPSFHSKPHFNAQKINIPKWATPQLGEFIGYLVGDGAISLNERDTGRLILSISDKEKDIADYIIRIAKELFGITATLQKKKDDLSTNYFFNSTHLVKWLRHIGVYKPSASEVYVPDIVFKAGRQFANGFLRGLFSADGTVTKEGYPSLCTISKILAEDLQQLLLSLGIPSNVGVTKKRNKSFGKRPLYRIGIITQEGIERFTENIGFISKNKNKRLVTSNKKAWEFNDILPNMEKTLRKVYNGPGRGCAPGRKSRGANRLLYRNLQHYLPKVVAHRNLNRKRLKRLAELHPEISSHPVLSWFLTNKQFYDRVAKIKEGKSLTLDLSIPKNNTYIANGFVSHNTRRGANMGILRVDHPDILEFITCKENDKAITNFNISVTVAEDFMKKIDTGEDYDLTDPHTKKTVKKLNAREVFNLIVKMAWKNGEPGIIFIDKMNEFNPTPKIGLYESTNPCGEQILLPYESCMAKDTRITTDRGIETVENLYKRQEEEGEVFIATQSEEEITFRSAIVIYTGKKPVFRVTLANGQSIRLTADHRVLTENGFKEVKDLKVAQDKIIIQEKIAGEIKFDSNEEYEKIYQMFGWMTGDGWFTKKKTFGLTFGPKDNYAFENLTPVWKKFTDSNTIQVQKNFVRCISSQKIAAREKLLDYGFAPARSPQKRVPKVVMTAQKTLQACYLQGLFSADGYLHNKKPQFYLSSASLELLKDVQLLLLNLGIYSNLKYYNIRSRGHSQGSLRIYGKGLKRFADLVGLPLVPHKQEKLKQKLESTQRFYKSKTSVTIASIKPDGRDDVYDVFEPATHTLIAEGMVIHNCNLGSINLSKMISGGEINWDKLAKTVKTTVHFLDNVIDMNNFPLKKIEEMTKANRKIGLGVMGFADMLIELEIPYNSDKAVALADKLMSFVLSEARKASCGLAEERDAFPNFKDSIYNGPDGSKQRNATLTTIAPTGSLSIIADCSSGIEPLFAIVFYKEVMDKDRLPEVNRYFVKKAQERGFWSEGLLKKITQKGNIQDLPEIPDDVKKVFVTSHDISPEWHIKIQAAFQKHTDNAVSKTINFPQESTEEDVREAYILAYKTGCKGVTVYRDKSREEQVLNIEKKLEEKTGDSKIIPRPRPNVIYGSTTKIATGCGNLYVTINEDENGLPFEVFMQMGKAGGCAMSQLEAIGRLLSLALRSGIEVNSIIEQLRGIRCPSPSWERGGRIFSCSDAIARVIETRLVKAKKIDKKVSPQPGTQQQTGTKSDDGNIALMSKKKTGNIVGICPDCGGALWHIEGCMVCKACGYSKCG